MSCSDGGLGGIGGRFRGGTNGCAWNIRIKAMKNCEEIGGAESETNASDVFFGDFEGVEANDLAAGIEKRATGVARIDGCVCLDPGAGAEGRKFSNSADDAFCGAEKHGIAGIADGKDGFALLDGGDIGEDKIGEGEAGRRGICFDEGDVEVGVDIDDAGLQLNVGRKNGEKRGIASSYVGVGGDDAGLGDEEARAHGVDALEADDGGLGALNDFFE